MDGKMNKDVKIGLSIGLLALIAIFCLVVLPTGRAPEDKTTTEPSNPDETVQTETGTPQDVAQLPVDPQPSGSEDHAVASFSGHEEATDNTLTADGFERVPDTGSDRVVDPGMRRLENGMGVVPSDGVRTGSSRAVFSTQRSYVVKTGDNLMSISKSQYGSTRYYKKIMEANGITDERTLKIGRSLIIPALNESEQPRTTSTSTAGTTGGTTHTVAAGETLSDISKKHYGTTRFYQKIMEANGITDERRIQVGKELIIPDLGTTPATAERTSSTTTATTTTVSTPVAADQTIHVVAQGETLMDISRKHYGTVRLYKLIMDANGITDPGKVPVGARLVIPPKTDGAGPVLASATSTTSGTTPGAALGPGESSHVVREGETVAEIANHYFRDSRKADLILSRNGITDVRSVRAGDVLIIPAPAVRPVVMDARTVR